MKNKPRRNRPGDRPERSPHPASAPEDRTAFIYGVLPVLEALRANARRVERISIAEGSGERRLTDVLDLARRSDVRIDRVSRESLGKLVGNDVNHQGIVAFTAAAEYIAADDIFDGANDPPLLVVLDGIEDPRNLGAVLRTVECAGADGVFIPDRRAVGLTDTVAKSSAGAAEYVNVAKVANINRLIEDMKQRNIWVVGTSGDAPMEYTEWDWRRPSALVLGAEGSGLHRLVAKNCDTLVRIPMLGKIGSLNVSVAAGVILFEAVRQRKA